MEAPKADGFGGLELWGKETGIIFVSHQHKVEAQVNWGEWREKSKWSLVVLKSFCLLFWFWGHAQWGLALWLCTQKFFQLA